MPRNPRRKATQTNQTPVKKEPVSTDVPASSPSLMTLKLKAIVFYQSCR